MTVRDRLVAWLRRSLVRSAWPVVGLSLALTVTALVLDARNAAHIGRADDMFLADVWVSVVVPPVGAYLIGHVGNLRLGAVLLATASLSVTNAAGQYATYASVVRPSGGPLPEAATWLATWTWTPYLLIPTLVPLLFPDGRAPSRRWSWLATLVLLLLTVITVGSALAPGRLDGFGHLVNAWGIRDAAWLSTLVGVLSGITVVVLAPLCLVAAVLRWRRARVGQRLALGWFVASAVLMLATLFVGNALVYPWSDIAPALGFTVMLLTTTIASQAGAAAAELHLSRERLVLAREEERLRLHRDLHDGLGPALAGVALEVGAAAMTTADAGLRDRLLAAQRRLQAMTREVRHIVEDLRPPALDELGLAGALQEQADGFACATGLEVVVVVPDDLPTVSAGVQVAAYRIASEALANVVRHSGARRCEVLVRLRDGDLLVEVNDDGHGPPDPLLRLGNGLRNMRNRAEEVGGLFSFSASALGGSSSRAVLPRALE